MTCDGLITKEQMALSSQNADSFTEFIETDNESIQTPGGKTKRSLSGGNKAIDTALSNAGWNLEGDFAIGVTINNANDVLNYDDILYRTTSALPLTTDGATPGADSNSWLAVSLQPLQQVARSLNALDGDIVYDTDTVTPIPAYIYSGSQQKTYSVPGDAQGETIVSVVGNALLVQGGGTYALTEATRPSLKIVNISQFATEAEMQSDGTVPFNDAVAYALSINAKTLQVDSDLYITDEADAQGLSIIGGGNFTYRAPSNAKRNEVNIFGVIPSITSKPQDIDRTSSIGLNFNSNQYFVFNTLSSGVAVQHTLANNVTTNVNSLGGSTTTYRHIQSRALTYLALVKNVPASTSGTWSVTSVPSGTPPIGDYTGGQVLFYRESSGAGEYLSYSLEALSVKASFMVGPGQGIAEIVIGGDVVATYDLSSGLDQVRDYYFTVPSTSTVFVRVLSGNVRFCGFNLYEFKEGEYNGEQFDTVIYHRDTNLFDDWLMSDSANDFVIRERTTQLFGCSYHGGQSILHDKIYLDGKETTLSVGTPKVGMFEFNSKSNVDWSVADPAAGNADITTEVTFGRTGLQINSYAESSGGLRCRQVITALAGVGATFDKMMHPVVAPLDSLGAIDSDISVGRTNSVTLHNSKNQKVTANYNLYGNEANRNGGGWVWNRSVYKKIYYAQIYDADMVINSASATLVLNMS